MHQTDAQGTATGSAARRVSNAFRRRKAPAWWLACALGAPADRAGRAAADLPAPSVADCDGRRVRRACCGPSPGATAPAGRARLLARSPAHPVARRRCRDVRFKLYHSAQRAACASRRQGRRRRWRRRCCKPMSDALPAALATRFRFVAAGRACASPPPTWRACPACCAASCGWWPRTATARVARRHRRCSCRARSTTGTPTPPGRRRPGRRASTRSGTRFELWAPTARNASRCAVLSDAQREPRAVADAARRAHRRLGRWQSAAT